jgi:uncharacterized membrane protein (UPF0127 family)
MNMQAIFPGTGDVLIEQVEMAYTPWARMRGLLGRAGLGPGKALHLAPCSAVHTFLMRFPLDLVFVSRTDEVVRVVRNVGRGRCVVGGRDAHAVLEMEAGWLGEALPAVGQTVVIRPRDA